jgi:murein DD-endopeptidase MepM/ murein hydrolase activator NlpD
MWRAVRSLVPTFVVLAAIGAVPVAPLAGAAVVMPDGTAVVTPGDADEVPGAPVGDAAVAPGAAEAREADTPWAWPSTSRVVVRPWEAPESEYGPGHRGLDVAAARGTPVVAVASGTVTFAGPVGGRPVVTVDHGDGLVSTLDAVDPTVVTGDHVEQGDPVGTTAAGHCARQACLHIGARLDGRYVDPAAFLPRAAWPVLLPDRA